LWSPDDPYLYEAEIEEPGCDLVKISYGIRTINYDAEHGLKLNGKPLKLNGACVHHDNGILGAAAYDDAEFRKALLMKEAGFNAVRTSHNPPSEAFLSACDKVGLLVIDESFDGWRDKKNDFDYHTLIDQWWQRDIDAMVCRDRLHPSVFCWSIGNEVIERKKIEVIKTARQMAERIRALDLQKRPVTSALAAWDRDWDIYDPLAAEHDIVGYNYMIHMAESDHARVPGRVMMQTESFPRDAWRNYQYVQNHTYILGDFVWTGLDYLGESGIGRYYYDGEVPGESWERPLYPWHGAYCGDVDLTGHRKPISFYRSLLWNGASTSMFVREPEGYRGKVKTTMWGTWPTTESWTWPGWEGKSIEVEVYSQQPPVKLYLNDKLIAEQETKEKKTMFTLPYQPGTLRAEAGNQRC
jgi:beta-galactosidase